MPRGGTADDLSVARGSAALLDAQDSCIAAAVPQSGCRPTISLRVEVQRTIPLDNADEALQAFSSGTVGKLVLVVQ